MGPFDYEDEELLEDEDEMSDAEMVEEYGLSPEEIYYEDEV